MPNDIHLFKPLFDVEACLAEIKECLERGWTGDGYKTVELEKAWCEYTDLKNSVFVNSGTAALHLALAVLRRARNWKDGDQVITTPVTFVATNHVILHERLTPVFADVDESLCLDPVSVEARITPKTRAVMFVGMGGTTGKLDEISKLCEEHSLDLILDGAHMAGTRGADGRHVGHNVSIACFSFHAVKPLPTGDSGMFCVAGDRAAEIARKLSWFGISKSTYARTQSPGTYRWRYDVDDVGWKYNGNAVMAAIGLVSLKTLNLANETRRHLASVYDEALENRCPWVERIPHAAESSRHLYQVMCGDRDEVMVHLNQHGVYPGMHYIPNTKYEMYRGAPGAKECPVAERMTDRLISLPLHLRMTPQEVGNVVGVLEDWGQRHGKA